MANRARKEQATDGPFNIGDGKRAWYYVDKGVVTLVSEVYSGESYVATSQTFLKASELKRMLKLLERA